METHEDFEDWLMFMEGTIQQLMLEVPGELASSLNYAPAALDLLESWLMGRFPSTQAILQPENNWLLDRLARYVGETFRRNAGGEWDIELTNERDAFFGLPVIKKQGSWVECPASLVTASLDRRRGNYMRTILDNLSRQ